MQVTGSDLIALLALVVSGAAAFYAKNAVDVARLANRISLHGPRADIFKAIFDYRRMFGPMDVHPTDDEMQDFYARAVLPAHLYLPSKYTERLFEIYVRSRSLFDKIQECESGRSTDSKWDYITRLRALAHNEVDQLIRDLADDLKLGNT